MPIKTTARRRFRLRLGSRALVLGERTLVMGVLNVTPDSFSDGGLYLDSQSAVAHALAMEHAGADLIDIGAESTRPGSVPVRPAEQIRLLLPVLKELRGQLRVPISVDTQSAEVAEAAADGGAQILNDVSALRAGPELAKVAARHRLALILMHMRGTPATMQRGPFARDAMRDVVGSLRRAVRQARAAGVTKDRIVLDPGFGFGKRHAQNFELLARLPELARLGFPIAIGPSRKSSIGWAQTGKTEVPPVAERLWGTAAAVTAAILCGAHIVRVHDVAEMAQVARVADSVLDGI
ncbi:MAG: dihydropteroate synthase [Candidatus Acidiferrales bacterium]